MAVFIARKRIFICSLFLSLSLFMPAAASAAIPIKISDQQREECFFDSTPYIDTVFRQISYQPGGKTIRLNYDIFSVSGQCKSIIKSRALYFSLQAPDKTGKVKTYSGIIKYSGLKGKSNGIKTVRLSKPLPKDKNSSTISLKMNSTLKGKDGAIKRECSKMHHFSNGSPDFVSGC